MPGILLAERRPGPRLASLAEGHELVLLCKPEQRVRGRDLEQRFRDHRETLLAACREQGFEHIQEAVFYTRDQGEPGTTIYVLPGLYREEPSRELSPECQELKGDPGSPAPTTSARSSPRETTSPATP
jgi:hypothetical protein